MNPLQGVSPQGATYTQEQLQALLGQQTQMRTVWTDIDAELEKCSPDEQNYIMADAEYQQACEVLRGAFYSFIEHTHRNEFLKHDKNGFAEKKLFAIKLAKERYARLSQSDHQIMNDPEVQALIERKRKELSDESR